MHTGEVLASAPGGLALAPFWKPPAPFYLTSETACAISLCLECFFPSFLLHTGLGTQTAPSKYLFTDFLKRDDEELQLRSCWKLKYLWGNSQEHSVF